MYLLMDTINTFTASCSNVPNLWMRFTLFQGTIHLCASRLMQTNVSKNNDTLLLASISH
jgi:hypothetical protein